MADEKMLTMDEFKTFLADALEAKIRELGLDKIDVKSGIFPTKDDPNGDILKDLTKEERCAKFLQAVVLGDKSLAKSLSEGSPADGGYLVPHEFRTSVVQKLYKKAVIRPNATIIPLKRDKMDVPADAAAVTTYWVGETNSVTESNPQWGNVTLDTNKLMGLSKMSRELFADSPINIMDYVSTLWAKAFAKEEDRVFMSGSGTGQPKGIRQYTPSYTVAQAGANITADDIINLFYALPVQYRENAKFLIHNAVVTKIRLLKDSQGRYLWTQGLDSAPNTILGHEVLEQNDIPTNLGSGTIYCTQ